jgi:hypothetical protein
MDGLADHFGENASLDPDTTAKLRDWLTARSAEHWDTRPANRFRRNNPDEPKRITATPGWVRFHSTIAPAVFTSSAVGAKGACHACHRDAATARFDPQSIAIPKDARP